MHRFILALIIAIYAVLGLLYAVKTPKWQAPDEPAHFNYIRAIGDTGTLPILVQGDYDYTYLEQIKHAQFPDSLSVDPIRYESYQPPLYYLAATPIYLATRPLGLNAQVVALRLFSVLLEVIVLLLAYTIVRTILLESLAALATVGLMATVPMHIAITASISNDTAAELVLALVLLLAIQRVRNRVSDRRYVVLGGVLFGAALLTKTTAYLPGALLLVGAEVGRALLIRNDQLATERPRFQFRTSASPSLIHLASLFLIAAAISAPMFIRNMLIYGPTDPLGTGRHDSIVVGQLTTAEFIRSDGLAHVLFDFVAITFKSFWAQFGWMGVLIDDRLYVLLFGLSAVAALGLLFSTIKVLSNRDLLTTGRWINLLLLALFAVSVVLAYIGYNFKFFQAQGRYLFAGMLPIAFFAVLGLRELLAREYWKHVFALLYFGLVALDLACLFFFIVPQLQLVMNN